MVNYYVVQVGTRVTVDTATFPVRASTPEFDSVRYNCRRDPGRRNDSIGMVARGTWGKRVGMRLWESLESGLRGVVARGASAGGAETI